MPGALYLQNKLMMSCSCGDGGGGGDGRSIPITLRFPLLPSTPGRPSGPSAPDTASLSCLNRLLPSASLKILHLVSGFLVPQIPLGGPGCLSIKIH